MDKVLLVEDSIDTQLLVKRALDGECEVIAASTLSEAKALLDVDSYQLLIIDIELPDGLGFEIAQYLQNKKNLTPIPLVYLTARTQVDDRITGFLYGADDYIEKPFNPQELKVRIASRLKKMKIYRSRTQKLTDKNFELDFTQLKAFAMDNSSSPLDLNLTPIEFKMLSLFIENPGQHFNREKLIELLWPDSPHMAARGVDTHISHLRKKMGSKGDLIESSYGRGYFYAG